MGGGDLYAQLSVPGTPFSFSKELSKDVPVKTMGSVDIQQLMQEDAENFQQDRPRPPRFGFPHRVDIGLDDAGAWTKIKGGRLWRLRIVSAGAYSINLIFDKFYMPEDASLFIYNDDHSEVLGAFTKVNNKPYGKFSTQPVAGNAITLEYYEPEAVKGEGELNISKVVHAYRNVFGKANAREKNGQENGVQIQDYGDSGSCNVNINCPEGNNWQDEKHAVAMVILDDGTRWCSGALVNNEREDYTPYFLSAFHCADDNLNGSLSYSEINDAESWTFMFNYESPSCSNQDGQTTHTVSGSIFRAGHRDSDFLLVELSSDPSHYYDPYFAGWSRSESAANNSVGIHHPQGDIKKISLDDDAPNSTNWSSGGYTTPPDSYWETFFEDGTVEAGSSGSPLFDHNHRIVGQLTGNDNPAFNGSNFCEVPNGWYGKFSYSWDDGATTAARLSDWLDPYNTGLTTLDGIYGPDPPPAPNNFTLDNSGNGFPSFSWNAVSEATSYNIYQRCDYNYYGDCTPHLSYIGNTTSTSFTDYSVIQGGSGQQEHYQYAVKAVNNVGLSDFSNRADVYGEPGLQKELSSSRNELPEEITIGQNYPNPFNPTTLIRFSLPQEQEVRLVVYDALGRVVQELVEKSLSAGFYTVRFDAVQLSSGIYFYKLETPSFSKTRSMTVIK